MRNFSWGKQDLILLAGRPWRQQAFKTVLLWPGYLQSHKETPTVETWGERLLKSHLFAQHNIAHMTHAGVGGGNVDQVIIIPPSVLCRSQKGHLPFTMGCWPLRVSHVWMHKHPHTNKQKCPVGHGSSFPVSVEASQQGHLLLTRGL